MKIRFIVVLFLSVSVLFSAMPMLKETPFSKVLKEIKAKKPVFLDIGSDSCFSCQEMGKILYKVKKEHPNFPIYFINVKKERFVAYELKVQMIPTQIILDKNGKEVFRHIGVLSEEGVETLLKKYIIKETK